MTFVATRLANLPQPIAGPNGQAGASALGSAQDDEAAKLRLVGKLRAPGRVDSTAINDVGVGYQIPRYASQSDATYQAAVVAAWTTQSESGSPQAIIDQLQAFGISDVRVVLEEQNHGAAPAYNGLSNYNRGQLVTANGNVYEQLAQGPAGAGGATPSGPGQAQGDGSCVWAWRCVASQDKNDPGYDGWWYSRFDVVLGGRTRGGFGTLAVNEFAINDKLGVSGSFTVPAVGSSVSVALSSGALSINTVVYVSQAGYYLVVSGAGPYVLQNLGDAFAAYAMAYSLSSHPAGSIFAPDVWGASGQFPNATPGTVIASGQQIAIGGSGVVGQTRIGIAIVDDAARQAVKSIVLRWKTTCGYAGRIVLAYNGAVLDPAGQPGYNNGVSCVGRMIGINLQIPFVIGGYDRS